MGRTTVNLIVPVNIFINFDGYTVSWREKVSTLSVPTHFPNSNIDKYSRFKA